MKTEIRHFKTLAEYLDYVELPRPEHPQFDVQLALENNFLPCPKQSSPPITNDCYSISLKKIVEGELNYGRTTYDFTNGALFFIAPGQVLQWDSRMVFEQKGFSINFHKDFLKGTDLAREIKNYGFFSYSVNEALHLSPKEESQIEFIVENIAQEYQNNQDSFSKEIIISQLTTLFKYSDRYYQRQFENRKTFSTDLLNRLNALLLHYLESGELQNRGIPSLEELAEKLGVTQRYLSDSLKKETGKSTLEHLQLYLIDQAKSALLQPNKTIAEVAYELGFEYPQYFSRMFKKKEGVSPSSYRNNFKLN